MRTKVLSTIALFMFGALTVFAGNKTEKFTVYGNCDMCKARIEKAARTVDGVSAADWNKDTKIIEVTYDDSKTDLQKINKAIADVGHDTDMLKASDNVYEKLPSCCKYDRTAEATETKKK